MASSKAALKSIKSHIDAGQYETAATEAQNLVSVDDKSYNGFMFLGFASEKVGNFEAAEKALNTAVKLKGQDIQPLKGLITLYEKQGAAKLDQYHDVTLRLAEIYAKLEDRQQCQTLIDKYQMFVKRHGTRAQYRRGLELLLPTSVIYPVLEGRIQHPSLTYKRLLESSEADQKEWISNEIAQRRTRLGAKLEQVTRDVKFEAISKFNLEERYQQLINWTIDDTTRHGLEEMLLETAYAHLQVVPAEMKPMQRDKVLNTANGMVIIKHPFVFAWNIALEWVDAEDLGDWDVSILQEYVALFPEQGLAKVLRAFLSSAGCPFPVEPISDEKEEISERLSEADRLILMTEGLEDCKTSTLAQRIAAQTYLDIEEHHSAMESSRLAQRLYHMAQVEFALDLQNSLDGVNLILARSLIHYQSPRHHPEARQLFASVLDRKPTLTAALLGIGLILEEDEDYGEAAKFLKQAMARDPSNLRIKLEHAWCYALDHDLDAGQHELEATLAEIEAQRNPDLSMKSETLYRIAYCKWHLDTSRTARKDRSGAYRFLIESMKANPMYAPPYTLLGIYFLDYGKSKQRAKQALQKAFELSSSELIAAEHLAALFAKSGEWDLVELVARRVVDSGKARPAPGSKKKAISWPYSALGIVQMTRQHFSQSIVSFQAALRIAPQDYHSWIALGESYHNSGRFVAAARAFGKAEGLDHGLAPSESWFASYMLANVQREVGAYDEAIGAYERVLDVAEDDFGVLMALLQSVTESASAKAAQGLLGQAVKLSHKAIDVARQIAAQRVDVFNLWKSVGDACSTIGRIKAFATIAYLDKAVDLLSTSIETHVFDALSDTDKIRLDDIGAPENTSADQLSHTWCRLGILSHKRAIHVSSSDVHAQAVAWYNVGWAEHEVYTLADTSPTTRSKKPNRYLKAAVKSFKRAIELEAGNAEFWNALGVVTMNLNPKISQHSFVRSLHLNDRSARTWTNLGVLYLTNNDTKLANEAFTRAQSADPEYAACWIGQGLLAMLFGNIKEARGLFTHAFEIADASSIPAKRHYAVAAFDHLLADPLLSTDTQDLLQPLFALRQLYIQEPHSDIGGHLLAFYAERVGDFDTGKVSLEKVCANIENEFERSESNEHLAKFAQAKADLARILLSLGDHRAAIESAETALDLSAEDNLGPAYAEVRHRLRLSAHITAGLAHSHLKSIDQSVQMFQAALHESGNASDVACMLAQVLWVKSDSAEREAARSQLFASVGTSPEHVTSVSLLAVIGLLDGDDDVLEAVEADLKLLRSSDKVGIVDKIKMSKVLAGIASCRSAIAESKPHEHIPIDALSSIMLAPAQPQGWLELSEAAEDGYVSEMALQTATAQIPPKGVLDASELAKASARSMQLEDVLNARMVAPWIRQDFEIGD